MQKKFKNKLFKTAALAVCSAMLMSGCSSAKQTGNKGNAITYPANGTYPVNCDDTLSMWMELNSSQSVLYSNFADSKCAQALEKQTGVHVEYQHPAAGLVTEQFNLLLTSGSLPDIIVGDWYHYGAQKALDEGIILRLNEILDKWAPNYKKVLEDRPEIATMLKTDKGDYYTFGFIRESDELGTYGGGMLRADWLKQLNMDVPETIDDWTAVLTAFKEKLNVESPLMLVNSASPFTSGFLTGAYGVTDDFYVEDGKVKYGPLEPGYKDFLLQMKQWYDSGLLDQNFAGADTKILENSMLNGKAGATYALVGGGMGDWMTSARATGNTEFDLVGAPYPVLSKGERPKFSQMDWQYTPLRAWSISRDCKNVELAARLLDYGYSDEGYLLMNYGVEGETFEMKDGVPTFTDFALNNPDGRSLSDLLTDYTLGSSSGPCLQSLTVTEATRSYPQQTEAVKKWKESDIAQYKLPMVNFTQEENDELGTILTDLHAYQDESMFGFIMGTMDLSNWDSYLSQMKNIGAEKAIEIYQKAVDRYVNR